MRFQVADRLIPEECPTCCPVSAPPPDSRDQDIRFSPTPDAAQLSGAEMVTEMARAGFNARKYRGFTLDNFDGADDPLALDAAWRYVRDWREGAAKRWSRRPWAFFYGADSAYTGTAPGQSDRVKIGKLGNGKTLLTWCITWQLLKEGIIRPGRFRFLTVEKLFLLAEATFRSGSETSEAKILEEFASLDLLVLDELGVRPPTSNHATRFLDEITKDRESNGLLWTGNISLPVIESSAPSIKRITDRILGECGDGGRYIVPFNGESRRLRRAKGEG